MVRRIHSLKHRQFPERSALPGFERLNVRARCPPFFLSGLYSILCPVSVSNTYETRCLGSETGVLPILATCRCFPTGHRCFLGCATWNSIPTSHQRTIGATNTRPEADTPLFGARTPPPPLNPARRAGFPYHSFRVCTSEATIPGFALREQEPPLERPGFPEIMGGFLLQTGVYAAEPEAGNRAEACV